MVGIKINISCQFYTSGDCHAINDLIIYMKLICKL